MELEIFIYHTIISTVINLLLILSIIYVYKQNKKIVEESKTKDLLYSAKLESIDERHKKELSNIEQHFIKTEIERNNQWYLAEKEALNVINNLSTLLEIYDTLNKKEIKKIYTAIDNLKNELKSE